MTNIQIIDSLDGGHFVFKQNDYLLDEGIYTELYCALFSTRSPEWLGDDAFDLETISISSKTENAIATYSSFTVTNVNLIKKAIWGDLNRLVLKNPEIVIKEVYLNLIGSSRLDIWILIEGEGDAYQFAVNKTQVSLDNLEGISDCDDTEDIIKITMLSGGGGIGISGGDGIAVTYN